jgi:para-nitrobenzyl esterase
MAPADPEVSTSAGRVRGRFEKGIAVFRGIPFAKPPIGPLRFQAPEPPAPWDGVREAKEFGPAAPQAAMMAESPGQPAPSADTTGEWLTVNVWTPDPAATRLPVLVWIYGGAYMFGASGEAGYDGTPFARGGAVFVSLNYRLGTEGFAQLPGAPANRGLLDAVAALTWVKDNIEGFGGDPANVTVFGESAGAGVIAAMLAMDSAKGLFKRAIAQSVPGSFFTRELATDIGQTIARQAGLPYTYQALAAADPIDLANAQMAVTARMKEFPQWGGVSLCITPFSPVIDGAVLPRSPWRALLAGAAAEVELLTGHNRDEYRLFLAMGGQLGNVTEDVAAATLAMFAPAPDGPAAYRKAFPDAGPSAMYELIFSDWLFRMPTLHLAQAHAASGGRTFLYELVAEAPAGPFGACHGLDVPLVFGATGPGLTAMLTGENPPAEFVAVGDTMRREWLAFAANGDPGWPAYGTEHRTTRVYDLQPDVVSYPEETSMHLWERHQFDALGLRELKAENQTPSYRTGPGDSPTQTTPISRPTGPAPARPAPRRLPSAARPDRAGLARHPDVCGQSPASRVSAPRTTAGSVVCQNGGSVARRNSPYRLVTSRGSSTATTPRSSTDRSSRPAPWASSRAACEADTSMNPLPPRASAARVLADESGSSGRGNGIRSMITSRSDGPGTSTPCQSESVPNRQVGSSSANSLTSCMVESSPWHRIG